MTTLGGTSGEVFKGGIFLPRPIFPEFLALPPLLLPRDKDNDFPELFPLLDEGLEDFEEVAFSAIVYFSYEQEVFLSVGGQLLL